MKNVLLYGGGTQSTGLLLMMLDGHIDGYSRPDMAVFSDTMSEPGFVNDYIKAVSDYVLNKYDFVIDIVSRGNLEYDILHKMNKERVASLPLFVGNGGMIRRQCTNEYKIVPINKLIKSTFDIKRKKKDSTAVINRIFGISLDEIERTRVSGDWWADNKYPLVEARMYRHEVIDYINNNHPEIKNPPRSSCYFCPFHSDNYWRALKENHRGEFDKAVVIDEALRDQDRLKNKAYVHRSLKPLGDIDFTKTQGEIFGECEGYCGI